MEQSIPAERRISEIGEEAFKERNGTDHVINNELHFFSEARTRIKVALVSIKDNGTGIDPDIFPRLFEKFAKSFKGTGLGLFICMSIVEAQVGYGPKIIETSGLDFTSHYRSYIVNDNKMRVS